MLKMFNQNEKGYAILFTVIIVSAISVIAAGISNAIYKQIVLSSLAKDSQTAFYMADTASDCALLFDMEIKGGIPDFANLENYPWSCGSVENSEGENEAFEMVVNSDISGYTIEPAGSTGTSLKPCYRISVAIDGTRTEILANGYNICNKNNIRTVERQIKIVYE